MKKFGLPYHLAPGEAEAECALLQREGLVDVVLSEDVDTLMFGSGKTMRNWSSEVASSKVPTHVNLYDAEKVKDTSGGLDKDGMVLVALMSGGDYVPQGIAGCGPKTACEAAKAGFGRELCQIPRKDKAALGIWRERLSYELRTNESHYFRSKHKALKISPEFPDKDVLGYYIRPVVSSPEQVDKLRATVKWQQEPRIEDLRTFTAEAFDWRCISGAKKFIRNLAPVLLVRELTRRSDYETSRATDDVESIEKLEKSLVQSINGKRTHQSTDNTPELRIGFVPVDLVPIDLEAEPPDEPMPGVNNQQDDASDSDVDCAERDNVAEDLKKNKSLLYDPYKLEKIWIPESYVRIGVPLTVQDWEESYRNPRKYQSMKARNKRIESNPQKRSSKANGMRQKAINQFTNITKPISGNDPLKRLDMTFSEPSSIQALPSASYLEPTKKTVIDLLSSPAPLPSLPSLTESPPPTSKRRQRSSFQRTQTLPIRLSPMPSPLPHPSRSSPIPSLDLACSPARKSSRHPPQKRTRARREGSCDPTSGNLDAWLHSPQVQSTAKPTPEFPIHGPISIESTNPPGKDPSFALNAQNISNTKNASILSTLQPVSGNKGLNTEEEPDQDADMDSLTGQLVGSTDHNHRKLFIHPRQSLKGAWQMSADVKSDLQVIDLTTVNIDNTGMVGKKERRKKAWRVSQIDILDMTNA